MPEKRDNAGPKPNATEIYRKLTAVADVTDPPADEEWLSMIERTSTPGRVHEISEEIYWYFLEVLPPKLMNGSQFAFAEGDEPLRLFWKRQLRYFCRQLTWGETHNLYDAAGLPRNYGYS